MDVLGIDSFDDTVFRERISRIEVPADNELRFILADGQMIERTWADRSRRESWTEDMKRAASARTKQKWGEKRAKGNDNTANEE